MGVHVSGIWNIIHSSKPAFLVYDLPYRAFPPFQPLYYESLVLTTIQPVITPPFHEGFV